MLSEDIVRVVYDCILFVFGVPANTLILVTFGRRDVPKSNIVIILLALASADLLSCVLEGSFRAAVLSSPLIQSNFTDADIGVNDNTYACTVRQVKPWICQGLLFSAMSMDFYTLLLHCLIAINCYNTIQRHAVRQRINQPYVVVLVFVFLVVSTSFAVIIGMLDFRITEFSSSLSLTEYLIWMIIGISSFSSLMIVIILNFMTVLQIIKLQKQSVRRHVRSNPQETRRFNEARRLHQQAHPFGRIHHKTKIQIIKKLVITTFIFAITLLTSLILLLLPTDKIFRDNGSSALYVLFLIVRDIWRVNHIINAFIYGYMSSKFRQCS